MSFPQLKTIEELIVKSGKNEALVEFQNLVKNLDESGLINKELTLEQKLMEPVTRMPASKKNRLQQARVQPLPSSSKSEVLNNLAVSA